MKTTKATVTFENEAKDQKAIITVTKETKGKDNISLGVKLEFIPDAKVSEKSFHNALMNLFINAISDLGNG